MEFRNFRNSSHWCSVWPAGKIPAQTPDLRTSGRTSSSTPSTSHRLAQQFNPEHSQNNANFISNPREKPATRGGQIGALHWSVSFPYSKRFQPSLWRTPWLRISQAGLESCGVGKTYWWIHCSPLTTSSRCFFSGITTEIGVVLTRLRIGFWPTPWRTGRSIYS